MRFLRLPGRSWVPNLRDAPLSDFAIVGGWGAIHQRLISVFTLPSEATAITLRICGMPGFGLSRRPIAVAVILLPLRLHHQPADQKPSAA